MRIVVVGIGAMAQALLSGWKGARTDLSVTFIHPTHSSSFEGCPLINTITALNFVPDGVILAVKPHILKDILPKLGQWHASLKQFPLWICLAAGKKIEFYEHYLGQGAPIIRTMPNLPVAVGQGVIGAFVGTPLSALHLTIFQNLFNPLGSLYWIKDEKDMDIFTALSGGAPAYIVYFMETLIKVMVDQGFDPDFAQKVVLENMQGTISLLKNTAQSPLWVRQQVASKGGTTEAALKTLKNQKFKEIINEALTRSCKRSEQMSKK